MQAGQVIADRYRLESPVGEGAMAAVWQAEDLTLKRQVAIKFLFVKGTRDPQGMVDQFLREARIAASVQHRNVIHTVDFGTYQEYQPFMVMELLSGESLGDRMEREPPLSREQVIHLISLTLRGLAAVHDAGIVHRDLKPHNIFLQRDSDAVYPKILDFGISRSLEQGEDRPSAIATQEGMIVGTPDYMSPEQARGEGNIDKRADIYSMGCILYEGLTGRLPFEADTIGDLIVQIVTAEPPAPHEVAPDVPPALSAMIQQAMAKDREHRFADARAMRGALLAAAEKSLPPSRRAAMSQPPAGPGRDVSLGNTGDGLQLAVGPPAAPRAPAGGGGATWGDFEGLNSNKMLDAAPAPELAPPSVAPPAPPQKQRMQAQAGAALELADEPSPGRRSRRSPPAGRAVRPSGPARMPSGHDALDPLYAGADAGAMEIDYDRVRPGAGSAGGPPHPAAQPRRTAKRPRSVKRVPGRDGVTHRRSIMPWLLPMLALVLLGYLMMKPSPQVGARGRGADPFPASGAAGGVHTAMRGASSAVADSEFRSVRLRSKQRRTGLRDTPPHMRDVRF